MLIVGQIVVWISAKGVARSEGCFRTVLWEVTASPSLECPLRKGLTITCYSFGCLWTCPCSVMLQLVPEILSHPPLSGFTGHDSHGCNKPCFCSSSMCCWFLLMAYKCEQHASVLQVGIAKKSDPLASPCEQQAEILVCVLCWYSTSIPRSLCCLPIVLCAGFPLISFLHPFPFWARGGTSCPTPSLCLPTGKSGNFIFPLGATRYQLSLNGWHLYLWHFRSSIRFGWVNEFQKLLPGDWCCVIPRSS